MLCSNTYYNFIHYSATIFIMQSFTFHIILCSLFLHLTLYHAVFLLLTFKFINIFIHCLHAVFFFSTFTFINIFIYFSMQSSSFQHLHSLIFLFISPWSLYLLTFMFINIFIYFSMKSFIICITSLIQLVFCDSNQHSSNTSPQFHIDRIFILTIGIVLSRFMALIKSLIEYCFALSSVNSWHFVYVYWLFGELVVREILCHQVCW